MNVEPFLSTSNTTNIHDIWHYGIGIFSLISLLFGGVSNGLVIFVFFRNSALRRPRNFFLINLAIADFCLLILGNSMHVVSSFERRWVFGQIGCDLYSTAGGIFGLTSISTMAVIALTRLAAVNNPLSSLTLSSRSTLCYIACAWIYGSIWILPPLFGWNRFVLEGFGTSCTFDYVSKDPMDRLFVIILVIGGFLAPFSIIVSSYIFILFKLYRRRLSTTPQVKNESIVAKAGVTYYFNQLETPKENRKNRGTVTPLSQNSDSNVMDNFRRTEIRATRTALLICTVFCAAWGPYAFMTLLSVFGFDNLVNAYSTSILGVFAKIAACINPLIYALSFSGFRVRICSYLNCIRQCKKRNDNDFRSSRFELHQKSKFILQDPRYSKPRTIFSSA